MKKCCDNCVYGNLTFKEHPCSECNSNFSQWVDATKLKAVVVNSENDPVNHPSHYTKGKIEVADFIADQKLNFDRGNAVKYVCRADSKDPEKEIQDLEKAIWYINHEIKMLKGDADA